jgi:glycosyltransferase involved in cell wall biosynthesis
MSALFVGPHMRSGIGHVTRRYAEILNAEYCEFGKTPQKNRYDLGFTFLIPLKQQITDFFKNFAPICKYIIVMAVCETETVHPLYSQLLQFQPVYCPSEFSRSVFQRQFGGDWRLLKHYSPIPKNIILVPHDDYVFYTIGNVLDYRKNIRMLLEAFLRLNLPNCRLVLKATTANPGEVTWKLPRVHIIQEVLTDNELDTLHNACDCYINCSFSEGVGMGAVEAAIRDKPVIISDYGGLKEYVKTPYTISCKLGPVGRDDFLFQKDMLWGKPDINDLMRHMQTCYDLKLKTCNHDYTRSINDDVVNFFEQSLRAAQSAP